MGDERQEMGDERQEMRDKNEIRETGDMRWQNLLLFFILVIVMLFM